MTDQLRVSLWSLFGKLSRLEAAAPTFDPLQNKEVLIWSGEHNAYWGPNGRGYFDRGQAGIYFFHDAYARSAHCGPEKKIAYELIESKLTNAYFSMQCSWIAKNAAGWSGDMLTLPETYNEPARASTIRRFCDDIREQLRIIEE